MLTTQNVLILNISLVDLLLIIFHMPITLADVINIYWEADLTLGMVNIEHGIRVLHFERALTDLKICTIDKVYFYSLTYFQELSCHLKGFVQTTLVTCSSFLILMLAYNRYRSTSTGCPKMK